MPPGPNPPPVVGIQPQPTQPTFDPRANRRRSAGSYRTALKVTDVAPMPPGPNPPPVVGIQPQPTQPTFDPRANRRRSAGSYRTALKVRRLDD